MGRTKFIRTDLPAADWYCTGVADVRPNDEPVSEVDYETCQYCGHWPVRWVHSLVHLDVDGVLKAGCNCAIRLTGDEISPKERQRLLMRISKQKQKLLSAAWQSPADSPLYLETAGDLLVVLPDGRNPGSWAYGMGGKLSRERYGTRDQAQRAMIDEHVNLLAG